MHLTASVEVKGRLITDKCFLDYAFPSFTSQWSWSITIIDDDDLKYLYHYIQGFQLYIKQLKKRCVCIEKNTTTHFKVRKYLSHIKMSLHHAIYQGSS